MEQPRYSEKMIADSLVFFDSAYQLFLRAASRNEEIRIFYRIVNFTFCLKFAGRSMIDALTPALQHLEIDPVDDCDLTICLWDSFSTQTPYVEIPESGKCCNMRGEMIGYNSDRIHAVLDIHTQVLNLFDKERKIALYWIQDVKKFPWWIGGSPLQLILHWWMREQGYQLTHAAVVGSGRGGVLFAGKSGSGKSTTTLACMKAGMQYVSEDYCLVSDLPEIWAYSIYNSAKIGEKTLSWFPELEMHVENTHRAKGDKAFLFHHKFQPEKILSGCPLKAIITLKIEETKESWLESIDPLNALGPLSVSTMWQLTHTGPNVFKHFQKIAKALPCYQLHLGSELMQAPRLIGSLL